MYAYCAFLLMCNLCVPSVYFDTVGWVFWPVKTVARTTYTVLVETLNHALSIYLSISQLITFSDYISSSKPARNDNSHVLVIRKNHYVLSIKLPKSLCYRRFGLSPFCRHSIMLLMMMMITRKPSYRWQTRATRKSAKIAPIRRAYNVVADNTGLCSCV